MAKAKLTGVPGGYQVWQVGKQLYLVYNVPASLPAKRFRLAWRVNNAEWARISGGKSKKGKIDRRMSTKQSKKLGLLHAGVSTELKDLGKHPFSGAIKDYKRAAKLRPWMKRREMVQLWAEAFFEGREVRDSDLKQTKWWRQSTAEERAWMELVNTDPKTAQQRREDNRIRVMRAMEKMGVKNPPYSYVRLFADRFTTGKISEAELQDILTKRNDPYVRGAATLSGLTRASVPKSFEAVKFKNKMYLRTANGDFELEGRAAQARFGGINKAKAVKGIKRKGGNDRLAEHLNAMGYGAVIPGQEEVKNLVHEYIGPYNAAGFAESYYAEWASRINRDDAAKDKLADELRNRAANIFDNYAPGTKYSDIAGQWRQLYAEMWGEMPDETSSTYWDIVRNNDMTYAQKKLRTEGIAKGNKKAEQDLQRSILEATNSGVRAAL